MGYVDLADIAPRNLLPGTSVRFVHTGTMTVAYWTFEAGAVLPAHSHPHEQVANILEGEFEMTVDGVTRRIQPGTVVVFPPGATHGGKAISRCRFIDVFHPVREDYR